MKRPKKRKAKTRRIEQEPFVRRLRALSRQADLRPEVREALKNAANEIEELRREKLIATGAVRRISITDVDEVIGRTVLKTSPALRRVS